MSAHSSEQFPSDPQNSDNTMWENFGADLMGKDATPEGVLDAAREMQERENRLRKEELQRHIFEFDDLLRRAPQGFADRHTLGRIASAAGDLVGPSGLRGRESQIRSAISNLSDALTALRREMEELAETDEPSGR
jgi:hypothetical protein